MIRLVPPFLAVLGPSHLDRRTVDRLDVADVPLSLILARGGALVSSERLCFVAVQLEEGEGAGEDA